MFVPIVQSQGPSAKKRATSGKLGRQYGRLVESKLKERSAVYMPPGERSLQAQMRSDPIQGKAMRVLK